MLSQKSLVHTKWKITHDHKSKLQSDTFTFNPDGRVIVEHNKSTFATWTISGDTLIIKYNDGYVDYRGRLVNNEIVGNALNKRGTTWGFVMTKLSSEAIEEANIPDIIGTDWHLKLSHTTDFNKAFGERHISFTDKDATILTSDGKKTILGTIKWFAKGNEITVTIGNFAKYVGKIENDTYQGILTNIKGRKVFFLGNKKPKNPYKSPDSAKLIFLDEKYSDPNKFHFLNYYIKYWIEGERNPAFDNHSSNILNLKKGDETAINYFYNKLNPLISKDEMVICYVPSSDPENKMSGVRKLCSLIAKTKQRIDGTHCIVRHTKIDKLASGGNRSIQVQLDSLKIENKELIKGKNVLLIDDVTTTNNSLKACKQLLENAGANTVYCFALGQTS